MGRRPCCAKEGLNRGAWTAMEDKLLREYIKIHGEGKWRSLPKRAGLKRCGKSCRLRWLNYLRPDIKRGNITRDEEDLIIRLHKLLGNRWSLIAGRLPGRTDNEIKNYWNTNIGKKVQSQPTSPTTNRKPSNQSKKNPKQSTGRSSDRPSSPTVGSPSTCVVHTKASRCNKVFIQPDTKPVIGPSINEDIVNNSNTTVAVPPQPVGATSPFVSGENDPYDFVMNFEVDEKFLSDFLENEFEPLCDLLGALEGDSNTNTNTSIDTSDSFPHSNQTASFSQEMLHVSDLGSMASLLDAEINWLQE